MKTSDLLRHQLIRSLTTQGSDRGEGTAVDLWAPMATQLILIIGAGGFDSLYARSVFLSQSSYPWLPACSGPPFTDQRFADLNISLQAQPPPVAGEANALLLITFTDILASMIGERLTTRILNSAWHIDSQDPATKEINNA